MTLLRNKENKILEPTNKKLIMSLPIRPIPTLTGEDARRFVERAEAVEKNPHTEKLSISREDIRKLMEKSRNFKFPN